MPGRTRDNGIKTANRTSRPASRTPRRGERQARGDAVTVALTAQVLICLVLLGAAGIAKKADSEAYGEMKAGYNAVTADESQNQKALEWLDRIREQGFFTAMESLLNGMMNRDSAGEAAREESSGEAADTERSSREQEDGDSENPEAAGGKEAGAETGPAFEYRYLPGEELTAAMSPEGKGGLYQVSREDADSLAAPVGTTLAPVYLSKEMKPPVTGVITSGFAYRDHPLTENPDFHTGVDIAADEGSEIAAALGGEVEEVGESEIYGTYVVLRHADNLQTSYSHCSEILVEEGDVVGQGERIALVGQTGMVTGPHLHFSVLVDGMHTDPYWVLQDNIRMIEAPADVQKDPESD